MVAYLTNRDGGITVFAKVSGEGGGFNFIGAGEEGSVTRRAISSGEKGVARGTARGGLDIVPGEGAAAGGEGIDMRRVNVVGSEATEFGAEVIDADKKNVLLGEAGAEKCEKDEEDSHKARPYESNRGTSPGNLDSEKLFSGGVQDEFMNLEITVCGSNGCWHGKPATDKTVGTGESVLDIGLCEVLREEKFALTVGVNNPGFAWKSGFGQLWVSIESVFKEVATTVEVGVGEFSGDSFVIPLCRNEVFFNPGLIPAWGCSVEGEGCAAESAGISAESVDCDQSPATG